MRFSFERAPGNCKFHVSFWLRGRNRGFVEFLASLVCTTVYESSVWNMCTNDSSLCEVFLILGNETLDSVEERGRCKLRIGNVSEKF